jgi:hypothetical protein
MRTYRVSLERRITVDFDADSESQAINGALYASLNGEYDELWDRIHTKYAGISDVTLPTNEVRK